ncbi:uncharacterized protein LOC134529000 [Bacillus rossius redtenbacheri]|uniref:uncharacterized protein LOC134529000 n=1 Tax=Bacillus rossius redtenbacheri TaxID=93214 RepID=UPI002FDD9F02
MRSKRQGQHYRLRYAPVSPVHVATARRGACDRCLTRRHDDGAARASRRLIAPARPLDQGQGFPAPSLSLTRLSCACSDARASADSWRLARGVVGPTRIQRSGQGERPGQSAGGREPVQTCLPVVASLHRPVCLPVRLSGAACLEPQMARVVAILALSALAVPAASGGAETVPEPSGKDFLRTVIGRLQSERERTHAGGNVKVLTDRDIAANHHSMEVMGPTPLPPARDSEEGTESTVFSAKSTVPVPPAFSKEELVSLYQAAVQKGASLDLDQLFGGDATSSKLALQSLVPGDPPPADTVPGYYYYYYPIKSFVKNLQAESMQAQSAPEPSHATMMLVDATAGDRRVDPLFVAMASFVSMALVFAFSTLFLPKFGSALRARGRLPDELAGLTRAVLAALEGDSCGERLACEAGRLLRGKSLRFIEAILPAPIRKQLHQLRNYVGRIKSCNLISCKKHSKKSVQ